MSFALQQPVLDDSLENHPSTWDLLPQLSDDQLLILLDFAMTLADETTKISNAPKYASFGQSILYPLIHHSRKPHERMIQNVENIEVLLQVSFGRGIKWLSAPINDPNYTQSVEFGEKICMAALKCFTVRRIQMQIGSR